jgi:GntR family transcriptional regulator
MAGEWSAGDSLPNEFALAAEYRVSVGTVRRAVEGLEKEGILVRKQGRGTFVAGSGRRPLQDKFTALRKIGGERGAVSYHLESLRRRTLNAKEASVLGCAVETAALEIVQSVTIEDRVVGVESSVVSGDVFPRLETQLTYGQHLYSVFNLYGVLVTRTSDLLSIVEANENLCRLTNVPIHQPLLRVERTASSHSDVPIEYRISHYDPVRVAYATTVS